MNRQRDLKKQRENLNRSNVKPFKPLTQSFPTDRTLNIFDTFHYR